MSDAPACVLDASALLALLQSEPGGEIVEAALDQGAISTVNWSEVHERLIARKVRVGGLRDEVESLGLEIVPFTTEDAEQAAGFAAATRHLGLSLADRACLALARRLDRPALTADRSWLGPELGVEIRPIR